MWHVGSSSSNRESSSHPLQCKGRVLTTGPAGKPSFGPSDDIWSSQYHGRVSVLDLSQCALCPPSPQFLKGYLGCWGFKYLFFQPLIQMSPWCGLVVAGTCHGWRWRTVWFLLFILLQGFCCGRGGGCEGADILEGKTQGFLYRCNCR